MGSIVQKSCNNSNICKGNKVIEKQTDDTVPHKGEFHYSPRYVYNKNCNPNLVENLMVRPLSESLRVYRSSFTNSKRSYASVVNTGLNIVSNQLSSVSAHSRTFCRSTKGRNVNHASLDNNINTSTSIGECNKVKESDKSIKLNTIDSLVEINKGKIHDTVVHKVGRSPVGVLHSHDSSATVDSDVLKPLFDINEADDKFLHSVLFNTRGNRFVTPTNCKTYDMYKNQTDFQFGFIPLSDPLLPESDVVNTMVYDSVANIHYKVEEFNLPNFLGARIPVKNQLNVDKWKELLQGYWDTQLLHFIQFSFPIGFNRNCPLQNHHENHKSAKEFPSDVEVYLNEEVSQEAIAGPFKTHPIINCHTSPFMTRPKANADNRRVIMGLSWP